MPQAGRPARGIYPPTVSLHCRRTTHEGTGALCIPCLLVRNDPIEDHSMNPVKACSPIPDTCVAKVVQECCSKPTALKYLAEKHWVAVLAYFCAFLPWGIIYAFDFIGYRWKTIASTRKEGILHIVFTLLPLSYVLFYAYLQAVAENFSEMAAALTAAVLSLLHVFRTIWGLFQLSVFTDWTSRALQCLSNMGYTIIVHDFDEDDGFVDDDQSLMTLERYRHSLNHHKRKFSSDRSLQRTVERRMIVNETIIDNAFHSAELPVRLRKRTRTSKVGTSNNTFWGIRFSDFLRCTKPEECAIRWSVAFLSQFGARWLKECKPEDVELPVVQNDSFENFDRKKRCITAYRNLSLFAFLHVTNRGPFSADIVDWQIYSPVAPGIDLRDYKSRQSTLKREEISKSCFPYCSAPRGDFALKRFRHTVTDAKNSWHAGALNALTDVEHSAVDAISATQIAAFLYILDKNPMTKNHLISSSSTPSAQAEVTFMKQLALRKYSSFSQLKNDVPIPNASFHVPLWSDSLHIPNRLLLQASVHVDNWIALRTGENIASITKAGLVGLGSTNDESIFETQKCFELDRRRCFPYSKHQLENLCADEDYIDSPRFLGCIMETVRSKIAEWISSNGDCNDWTTALKSSVEFSISPQLDQALRSKGELKESVSMRLLWEAQSAMHIALSINTCTPPHLMEEAAFLCILGFPSITVERESSTKYKIRPRAAPQEIILSISVVESGRESRISQMKMWGTDEGGNPVNVPFHWTKWRNAFYGRLYAQSEWRNIKGLAKMDTEILIASEMQISEGIRRHQVQYSDTGPCWEVKVWDGWRPHYPQIAFFEVFEELTANRFHYASVADVVLTKAIAAVETVISGENQISEIDNSWVADYGSVIEMHAEATKEINKRNLWKALQGLSYCVKEFGHEPSLRQMLRTVFRSEAILDEEVNLLFNSMCIGAKRMESQTNAEIERPYSRFSYMHLGYIFAHIYSKTRKPSALEYSMVGVPLQSSEVYDLRGKLGLGSTRCHLFLAICFLRSYKDTKSEAEKKNAIDHLSRWGRSFDSSEAALSIGFLFEKGSFFGRDAHKLFPLLQQFTNEPMVEAMMTAQFLPWVSFPKVSEALHLFERPERFKDSIQTGVSNVLGMEPDKSSAVQHYRYAYELSQSKSTGGPDTHAMAKSIALNRQGLMKLGENLSEALALFQNAASCTETTSEIHSCSAYNNVGIALHMQSKFSAACETFGKAMSVEGLEEKRSWEMYAKGSIGCRKRFSAKAFSPATTAANNLAVTKERMSEQLRPSEAGEVDHLYETASKEGHPVAMYNYAVYVMSGHNGDISKADQLLKRVLILGNELFPMHNLIAQAMFLKEHIYVVRGKFSWKTEFDEIDGCMASVKCIEYTQFDPRKSFVLSVPTTDEDS